MFQLCHHEAFVNSASLPELRGAGPWRWRGGGCECRPRGARPVRPVPRVGHGDRWRLAVTCFFLCPVHQFTSLKPGTLPWCCAGRQLFPQAVTPYEVLEQALMEGTLQTSIHICHGNGQWMSRLPEKLWDIPLYNLALPGSHDTMTYCLDKTSDISGNESKLVKFLNKCMPCIVRPIIMKWSTTQVLTVTEQLEAGVRYLDFRIAHKANDPSANLYFVHMVYTTITVQDILWEVLRWLETHPQEVVILACRNFDGLTKKLHCLLIACIKEIFQCKLCPRNVVPTLRTMWQRGHQVIVSYEEDVEVDKHRELWPAIPYWWGNKTATRALIQYLERMKQVGRPEKFFVAGINLTENLRYILVHPFGSLKKMTLRSLPCLKIWIKQQYPGPKKECVNIIAGDFIGNHDFVKDVIELNTKINPPLHCQSKGTGTNSISF
ncbi:PI-PLC X domain-containing protein 1 isoform X2 [Falco peregrinus]|uniref:PI-PLC X domain-containing protein 1 isoform X2 n=1 Tax=Falco peregrinus TaxID=8954 RepID=UPI002478F07D|nr:PI-PLC X domain-containing protein 1 isoform X2 [Falco peregrinus]